MTLSMPAIVSTSEPEIAPARSKISPAQRLAMEAQVDKAEVAELSRSFNDSTSLSWLWAFLFGPIYFAVHGFWGRAVLVFVLNLVFIGPLVAPFLAYPAWRQRAEERAANMLLIDKFRSAS
jgi:hypothetical protein